MEGDDLDAAFENFRTTAELAAKALLHHAQVPYEQTHNVAGTLSQQGLWPKGRDGRRLSALLQQYTRGVYGFSNEIAMPDVAEAAHLTQTVMAIARQRIQPP